MYGLNFWLDESSSKTQGMSAIVVENCSKAVEIITEFLFVDIEMLQNHCSSHSVLQGHKF